MAVQETQARTTFQLPEVIDGLPSGDREVFTRLFQVTSRVGVLDPGAVALNGLASQPLTRIRNMWDHRQVKFNQARAERPQQTGDFTDIRREIEEKRGNDPFCRYETQTPLNPFGRIQGETCVTAGNLYMASPYHAVQIFNEHDPLVFPTEDQFLDRLDVARRFFKAARQLDPDADKDSYMQNNMFNAAASMWWHGHAQLEAETGYHEGEVEELLAITQFYHHLEGRDYFVDYYRAHEMVGLGMEVDGLLAMASLTPIKENSMQFFAYHFDDRAQRAFYRFFKAYFADEGIGAKAFNLAIEYRPAVADGRDWNGFPAVLISLVDRGDPTKKNADMGASEMLKKSVIVASDPYSTFRKIREAVAA